MGVLLGTMRFFFAIPMLSFLLVSAMARADIVGKIKAIDNSGILLDVGSKINWDKTVSKDQRTAIAKQYGINKLVRIKVSNEGAISIRDTSILAESIKQTPLMSIQPLRGGYDGIDNESFWGHIPTSGGKNLEDAFAIYSLKGQYDFLTFGFACRGQNAHKRLCYRIGSNDVSYVSLTPGKITWVTLDIKGVDALGVWTDTPSNQLLGVSENFIIDPLLHNLPASIVKLASPTTGETIDSSETLNWRPTEDAMGYLVEIQCIRLFNTEDMDKHRFHSIQVKADTRSLKISDLKLPVGEYRWRVHSLDDVGVMGQMDQWWDFKLKQ